MSQRQIKNYRYPEKIRKDLLKDKKAAGELKLISRDDFDALCDENREVRCIGRTFLLPLTDKQRQQNPDILTFEDENGSLTETAVQRNLKGRSLGYLRITDIDYAEVIRKRRTFLLILLPLLILLLGIGAYAQFGAKKGSSGTISGTQSELETEVGEKGSMDPNLEGETASPEEIAIPVYPTVYVTDDASAIPLNNPEGNTVYFQYTVCEGDTVLFETKAISPGYFVTWDASDLSAGEHELTFKLSTYDINDESPCNGSDIAVKVIRQ